MAAWSLSHDGRRARVSWHSRHEHLSNLKAVWQKNFSAESKRDNPLPVDDWHADIFYRFNVGWITWRAKKNQSRYDLSQSAKYALPARLGSNDDACIAGRHHHVHGRH